MAKKRYTNSEAKNARWIKEGRGRGLARIINLGSQLEVFHPKAARIEYLVI